MKSSIAKLVPSTVLCTGAVITAGCALYFEESSEKSSLDRSADSSASCSGEELHVFGSYEARSSGARDPWQPWPPPHVQRDSRINIERPGRHKIVVSAYEPVRWQIYAAPGVEITQVVAVGYHAQEVFLSPGIDANVTVLSYEQGGEYACGYSWPYNGGGCDTQQLFDLATRETGLPLTSFHGCYQVDKWALYADLSADSTCGSDGGGYQPFEYIPESEGDPQCEPGGAGEVQVVGVYQTRDDHSFGYHPVGTGRIRIDRPGRQALVLSSYEPTNWKIEVGPDVELQAVYATGYHAQTVELPPGSKAKVETFSNEAGSADGRCGFRIPAPPGTGCRTDELLRWAAEKSGLEVKSFRGCYDGRNWHIGKELETSADCRSGDLTEKIFDE